MDEVSERQYAIEQRIEGKFYSGPLPQADELQKYSAISADFPNRIFAMAEKEQVHRHQLEQRRMGSQIWIAGAGQMFGFILALTMIVIGGILLYFDKSIGGFGSLLAGLVTLVWPFVYGKRRPQPEKTH